MKLIGAIALLGFTTSISHAASFDCNKASSNIERLICRDAVLSSLDERLAKAYRAQLSLTDTPEKTKAAQRQWLAEIVNKCDAVDCLHVEYIRRIDELQTDNMPRNILPAPSEEALSKSDAQISAHQDDPTSIEPQKLASSTNVQPIAPAPIATSEAVVAFQPVSEKPKAAATEQLPETSKPPSTISDFFGLVLSIFAAILVAAFIRPTWVLRWESAPSRKKVALYLLPLGFLIGGLAEFTRTDERKAYDIKIVNEKKAQEEQASQQRHAKAQGYELYKSYKSASGNEDTPNYNEDEYMSGALISTCNINGKPRGKYGWIEFRTVFMQGERLKDAPIVRMYVFAVSDATNVSAAWRGEQYISQLEEIMQRTCD